VIKIAKRLISDIGAVLILTRPIRILLNYLYIRLDFRYVKFFVEYFDKCRIKRSFYWKDEFLGKEIIYPVLSNYQTSWNVALSSRWHEPEIRKFLEYFISNNTSNKVFFDIGSNHGLFSFPFLSHDYECYLFEPQKECNDYVYKVAELNRFNPNIVQSAVSDNSDKRESEFYISQNSYLSSLSKTVLEKLESPTKIIVSLVSIDSYCEKIKKYPSIIKIDVEGTEFDVIKGAKNLIEEYKPTLLIEVSHDNSNKNKIYEFLELYYYQIFSLKSNEFSKILNLSDFLADSSRNYACIAKNSLMLNKII